MNSGRRQDAETAAQHAPELTDRQFAAIAKALADPRRLRILGEISASAGALPCCALSEFEKVSAATISHHIKELETAGLIATLRKGRFVELVFQRTILDAYLTRLSRTLSPAS